MAVTRSHPDVTVKRLSDDEDLRKVLNFNLKDLDHWNLSYPNHEIWIRNAVEDLKRLTYDRIAFGGYYYDVDEGKLELCCSVILKKNPFTPYLEIKNLILIDYPKNCNKISFKEEAFRKLIEFIINFAEQRGYPKLVTELFNKNFNDRELIKIFVSHDFLVTGNQINRYTDLDEIIYLTREIDQIYQYDPFDNSEASLWIIRNYLKSGFSKREKTKIQILDDKGQVNEVTTYTFYTGKLYKNSSILQKFNTDNRLIIIEEYFRFTHNINSIKNIIIDKDDLRKHYIFDFSTEPITNNLLKSKNQQINNKFKIFNRSELIELLKLNNEKKRKIIEYNDMGALLLMSDPNFFPIDEAINLLNNNKKIIYIKLGSYGRYLQQGMYIAFAYFSKDPKQARINIWGIAELAIGANLLQLDNNESSKSMSERLYSDIEDLKEDDEIILWNKSEFERHNIYNPTNKIIPFKIKSFISLSNPERLDSVISSEEFNKINSGIFDTYLNKSQAHVLKNMLEKGKSELETDPQVDPIDEPLGNYIKFLYVGVQPIDQLRLKQDYESIRRVFLSPNIAFITPLINTYYGEFLKIIRTEKPAILHFSGHGKEDGIILQNSITGKSEFLSNDDMRIIFSQTFSFLRLVFLNSCLSFEQARIISIYGIFVIAVNVRIADSQANNFAKAFYEGCVFFENSTIKKAIYLGYTSLLKTYPEAESLISLWYKGENLKYENL